MKREHISDALNLLDNDMIKHTEMLRSNRKWAKRRRWYKWCAIAACLCLLYIMGISHPYVVPDAVPDVVQNTPNPSPPQNNVPPAEPETFVSISSLLAKEDSDANQQLEKTAAVPMKQYVGQYVKTASVESKVLSESIGTTISGTTKWYYVSGHTDLQYLIQKEEEGYSLWKFKCFNHEEYAYSEVLSLVYQIDSADKITKIQVNPAAMDNTDSGKKMQAEIGTRTITDKSEIETIYRILTTLTCYGQNHWDLIDYGDAEAAADKEITSSEAVRFGRYLTLVTKNGNEIDGLKYTAISNMFYEFSGIAYNKLTEKQARDIAEILGIEQSAEK